MAEVVRILVNGEQREVHVISRERNALRFEIAGREYSVEFPAQVPEAASSRSKRPMPRPSAKASPLRSGELLQITAPIPGVICEVIVKEGARVESGELLLRLEAMKMQNGIFSPASGTIEKVFVEEGREVLDGEVLIELKPG